MTRFPDPIIEDTMRRAIIATLGDVLDRLGGARDAIALALEHIDAAERSIFRLVVDVSRERTP